MMKNESGKHFFYLDRPDYANFPDEKEVLLQAGLIFKVHLVVIKKTTTLKRIKLSQIK
jgi:hypothetical protein